MQQDNISNQNKPTIYWILQENHITPFIIDFLKLYKSALTDINLKFMVPSLWKNVIHATRDLDPQTFDVVVLQENTYDWFCKKRDAIKDIRLTGGLQGWRVLLQDDLHSGHVTLYEPRLPENPSLQFILMQIPIPLGSLENEERIFHSCLHWARARNIPVIGYELLPFDTKWTMLQALVDGVITTKEKSYDWLISSDVNLKNKVWLLPRYERRLFSPSANYLWRSGLGIPYDKQHRLGIPQDKTILLVPHNVAMSYEYKILIKELSKLGDQVHLMISVGKDQVRGSHSHQELVELLSRDDLVKFHSYSFFDLNKSEELVSVDAVVACASCHLTEIASLNTIPSLIVDPNVTKGRYGYIETVNRFDELNELALKIIESHGKTQKLADIFYQMINRQIRQERDR